MTNNYQVGGTVFGEWQITRLIGEGSFGRVFGIQREDFGEVYRAALKVITVPQNEAEVRAVMEEGMSAAQAEQYFYSMVEDIVREFAIMAKLKGTANVVSYEDHKVIRRQGGIGWDILIRMELLTPFSPMPMSIPSPAGTSSSWASTSAGHWSCARSTTSSTGISSRKISSSPETGSISWVTSVLPGRWKRSCPACPKGNL